MCVELFGVEHGLGSVWMMDWIKIVFDRLGLSFRGVSVVYSNNALQIRL